MRNPVDGEMNSFETRQCVLYKKARIVQVDMNPTLKCMDRFLRMEVGKTFTAEDYVYQAITQLYRVPSRFIVYILGELVTSFNHQIEDSIEDENEYKTKLTEFEHKGRPSKNETEQYTRDVRTYNDAVEHHEELVNFLKIIHKVLKMKQYENNDDV